MLVAERVDPESTFQDEPTGVRSRAPREVQIPRLRLVAPPVSLPPRPEVGDELSWSVLLSAVAGYVDAAGFLALFGLYTAHVTGDLVTAGLAVSEPATPGVGSRVAMIPVFMLTVAAITLAVRSLRRHGMGALAPMLGLMAAALGLFALTGTLLRPDRAEGWSMVVVGGIGVAAMGIQNTLMREVLNGMCATTLMTGNLTQVTIDLVELAVPSGDPANRASRRAEAWRRLRQFGLPLGGFLVGTGLGAWVTATYGLAGVALPAVATAALAFFAWRKSRSSAAL